MKFKQLLLLALRVLIILFLVAAFARPTLKSVALSGVSSAAKTSAVFILDNTYSMSVVGNKGSYFNQAKEILRTLIDQLQEGDNASIVLMADNHREAPELSTNLANLKNEVNKIKIGLYSGTINEAVIKAAKLLEKSKNYNKEIYLISDLQKDRLYNHGATSDLSDVLNKNIRIYYVNFPQSNSYNIGIDSISSNTQIFEWGKPVSFNVTIKNYSKKVVNNVVVSLFVNGKRSAQQSVNLASNESKVITMESIINDRGFVNIFAELEDDDILQDNRRYVNIYIPKEIPIGIFSDNQSDYRFIKLALTASQDSSLKITEKSIEQMSSTNLSQFSAVILIGANNYVPVENLKSFISQGKGLFVMPGSSTSLNDFQSLCKGLSIPQPSREINSSKDKNNFYTFDKVDLKHPIFHDIFLKNEHRIESPDIYKYLKFDTKGEGRSIISLLGGSSFLSEYDIKGGKIFVLASAPDLNWSNFPLKGIFVPLMNKSIFYLASKDISSEQYLVGNSVNIDVSNATIPQIKILKPDGSDEYFNINTKSGFQYFTYNNTDEIGNYKVFSGKNMINDFSVNFDPRESDLKYASRNDLQDYFNKVKYKGKLIKIDSDSNIKKIIMQSRFGSELWKLFILIALILALIEMSIAKSSKKDLVEVNM